MLKPLPKEIAEYQLNDSVGYLLARTKSATSNIVNQHTMAELGITHTQASIVFMLAKGRCSTAVDLAHEYGIDASAITRLVDRLEKRGLLRRLRNAEDRRVVKLELTDAGYAAAARLPAIFKTTLATALAGFAPEEIDQMRHMLRRMLSNAEAQILSDPYA
jgi:DNA-binding MarR family transcriptional regulator